VVERLLDIVRQLWGADRRVRDVLVLMASGGAGFVHGSHLVQEFWEGGQFCVDTNKSALLKRV
jgi:hypothetical protein